MIFLTEMNFLAPNMYSIYLQLDGCAQHRNECRNICGKCLRLTLLCALCARYLDRVRMMDHQINEKHNGPSLSLADRLASTTYVVYLDNLILWCSFARPYFPLFDTAVAETTSPPTEWNMPHSSDVLCAF